MKKISFDFITENFIVFRIVFFATFLIILFSKSNAQTIEKIKSVENKIVLLENKYDLLPLKRLDTICIAAISVGENESTGFQKMLSKYSQTDFFNLSKKSTSTDFKELISKLGKYNIIIAGIHSDSVAKSENEINEIVKQFENLSIDKKLILTFFCSATEIKSLNFNEIPDALIVANSNNAINQSLAAQLLFGGIAAEGKISENIGTKYRAGDGISTIKTRLKYTIPEDAGINSAILNSKIDSITNYAISKKAFPGCNILVAVDGKIILQKAYGYQTFENEIQASINNIYDLASVTKIAGGLPGILKLYDSGKINLDNKVAEYYPEWKNRLFKPSDKSQITIRELYAHQSGLVPFIPFWKSTLIDGNPSVKLYSSKKSRKYSLFVAKGMYLNKNFKKTVKTEIRKNPLKSTGKYVYSDLPLVITPDIVERLTKKKFDEFLNSEFYKPLGAFSLTYNPLEKFNESEIMPSENDDYYRNQQIRGSVHDESAAVMGGISGNAGLFANSNDLAKLMQMYLQMGHYGGQQFISQTTMQEFSRVQFPENNNRRALIFDKPSLNHKTEKPEISYPCIEASDSSFGHSGFTGTFVWMDPEYKLLYIFLSNRVYPTRNNNLISTMNVRTEILSSIYKTIKTSNKK